MFDLPAFKTPSPAKLEDKLPSISHDISRPSSSSTVASHTQQRNGSNASIQLPSLATLASAASNGPTANNSNENNDHMSKETPEKKMPSPQRYVANPRGYGWRQSRALRRRYLRPAVPFKAALSQKAWRSAAPQLFLRPTNMASSKPSNGLSMTYATSAPATAGGQAGSPVRSASSLVVVLPQGHAALSRSNFVSYLIDSHYASMMKLPLFAY